MISLVCITMAGLDFQKQVLGTLIEMKRSIETLREDMRYLKGYIEDTKLTQEERKQLDESIALKFLKSIKEKELLKRIGNKINELEKNPYPQDIERVEGYKNVKVFRVRVGDYRILYFVDHAANKIYVEKK